MRKRRALVSLLFIHQHAEDDAASGPARSSTPTRAWNRRSPASIRYASKVRLCVPIPRSIRLTGELEQMAVDRPIQLETRGSGPRTENNSPSTGFLSVRYSYDGLLTCTPTSSLSGNRTFCPNRGRRLDVAFVDPGARHTEPGAVVEREFEESRLGPRILDERRIEPDRHDPAAVDLSRLAVSPAS